MTATLQSEQYRRRLAFSSSVSVFVSASGSASSSTSGSTGELGFDALSSPPVVKVVSVAAVAFGTSVDAGDVNVGAMGGTMDARGCASRSTGDSGSGSGAAPGILSAKRNRWVIVGLG